MAAAGIRLLLHDIADVDTPPTGKITVFGESSTGLPAIKDELDVVTYWGGTTGGGTSGPETPVDHGSMGSTETLDITAGTWHRGTLSANCTITVSGFVVDEGLVALFKCTQNGTGGYGITWDADVVFSESSQPSQGAGDVTWYMLWSDQGDTVVYGAIIGNTASTTGIEMLIDGAGSTITTGIKGDVYIPFNCTITGWTILGDQSGSIVIDVWKDTYANYPPVVGDSITASAKPTISSAVKAQSSTLTGWTTTIAAGSTLRFNVDSCTTIQRVTITLTALKA